MARTYHFDVRLPEEIADFGEAFRRVRDVGRVDLDADRIAMCLSCGHQSCPCS